jgi:hypothetical protein
MLASQAGNYTYPRYEDYHRQYTKVQGKPMENSIRFTISISPNANLRSSSISIKRIFFFFYLGCRREFSFQRDSPYKGDLL